MGVERRLISSFAATILGPIVTVFILVINVPVMLRFWGAEMYGEWLVLSVIPTYLLLTDLGFGSVAASDMTIRVHAGDSKGAIKTFQSALALVMFTTISILILLTGLFMVIPIAHVLHFATISANEARKTLAVLSLNCLVVLQWSVISAGYRCSGQYARVMLYINCIRIMEGGSCFVLLFTHARPLQLATLMLIISILGTSWLVFEQHRHLPWLRYGFRYADLKRIRELSKPAFAFMAFPTCAAISTQGMTLAVGLLLGPVAVAVFNPMRTLSRIPLQLTDAVKNSVWPELSGAFGRNDLILARRLHRSAFQLSVLLALLLLGAIAIAGPKIFLLWTHGSLPFNMATFYLLLVSVLFNSVWNASSSVAMSANRHERMSVFYLVFSIASILIACLLMPIVGLRGSALGMLIADLGMSFVVLHISNKLLFDPLPDFLYATIDFTQMRNIYKSILIRIATTHNRSNSIT